MKLLYYCYGGSHSSVTAAAIHLGILPSDRIPSAEEFLSVPYFDGQVKEEHGEYKFMGNDDKGNEIYVVGVENFGGLFERLFYGTTSLFGIPDNEYELINSLEYVNNLMRLGGYLSRRMGLVSLGRPVVIKGTQAAYWEFVRLVDRVKQTH